jgi:hypothetical protein
MTIADRCVMRQRSRTKHAAGITRRVILKRTVGWRSARQCVRVDQPDEIAPLERRVEVRQHIVVHGAEGGVSGRHFMPSLNACRIAVLEVGPRVSGDHFVDLFGAQRVEPKTQDIGLNPGVVCNAIPSQTLLAACSDNPWLRRNACAASAPSSSKR